MDEVKLENPENPFAVSLTKSHATMKDRVTYFKLEVKSAFSGEEKSFTVRFSDIADFRDSLEALQPLANQLPPFPARTAKDFNANHLQAEFVDKRIKDVLAWFEQLWTVPDILTFSIIYEFFKMDPSPAHKLLGQKAQEKGKPPELDFKISVPGTKSCSSDPKVTFYTVNLTYPDSSKDCSFERRFNDFKTLNSHLMNDYAGNSKHLRANIPPFPESKFKLFTNHSDPTFVEERRCALENYMQKVIEIPHALKDIHLLEFLGLRDI